MTKNEQIKTTIETINGMEFTVVWHGYDVGFSDPKNGDYLYESVEIADGSLIYLGDYREHIATALPALPRNPKPEHAALLYAYASHGLMVVARESWGDKSGRYCLAEIIAWNDFRKRRLEITHALDPQGNKIDIAITGKGVA